MDGGGGESTDEAEAGVVAVMLASVQSREYAEECYAVSAWEKATMLSGSAGKHVPRGKVMCLVRAS